MIRKLLSGFLGEYKQVILVRTDLKLPKGKMAAQVAHASVDCVLKSYRSKVMRWKRIGMKKIVLKVADLNELKKYQKLATEHHLKNSLISDAGRTTVKAGTVTVLGIGPDLSEKIDKVTGELKMM
jgi:peptidyl-tRNA hydrolase, PTH2 family